MHQPYHYDQPACASQVQSKDIFFTQLYQCLEPLSEHGLQNYLPAVLCCLQSTSLGFDSPFELCCLYTTHFFITAKLAQHPSPLLPRWLGSSARMLVSQGTLWLMFHSQTCANWLQAAFCGGVPCTHISWGHIFRQIYLAPPVFRRFLSIPTFFNLSIMTAEVVLHLFLGSHECPNLYRLS
jgi:hypothetical protein